jgi:hypothetical protein
MDRSVHKEFIGAAVGATGATGATGERHPD